MEPNKRRRHTRTRNYYVAYMYATRDRPTDAPFDRRTDRRSYDGSLEMKKLGPKAPVRPLHRKQLHVRLIIACILLVQATVTYRNQKKVLLALLVTSLLLVQHKDEGTTIASTQTEDVQVDAAATLQNRLALYRRRYDYRPAAPRPTSIDATLRANGADSMYSCGNITDNFADWFKRPAEVGRSANDEDKTIWNSFFRQLGTEFRGTFVEMGAFDGLRETNSNFFETCLGWEGILVEANPAQWPNLVRNRPYAHRFHFAPSCNDTVGDNVTLPFYDTAFTNAGLATSDVKSAYTNNFVKRQGVPVQVPCASLTNVLLDMFPSGHINFFSLDVEGAEPLVIGNAIDFSKVFIEVLMVEQYNNLCPKPPNYCESREKVRSIMKENGYVLKDNLVIKSDVYIHPLEKQMNMHHGAELYKLTETLAPENTDWANRHWDGLSDRAQKAATLLGFNKNIWDTDSPIPIYSTPFDELTEDETEAVIYLGLRSYFS